MFWNKTKKRVDDLEGKTEKAFSAVKSDISGVGKWIKHLDSRDKEIFDIISGLREELDELSTVNKELVYLRDEVQILREELSMVEEGQKNKQVFKKLPVLDKHTAVEGVQEAVQTAVQTDNYYEILRRLSGNERLIVFTLLNSDMKLSYEDLALLLGKERSTIRGQINSIKQKSEGLIEEIAEKSGKKRVFIPEKLKEKLQKYAKVRVKNKKKGRK